MDTAFLNINSNEAFAQEAMRVFRFQAVHNAVYKAYLSCLGIDFKEVQSVEAIPFLPISFFKTHGISTGIFTPQITFTSSGTTGANVSRHLVKDLSCYDKNFLKNFERCYGAVKDWVILALLPSYLEREGSSLVYMAQSLIRRSGSSESGFYLNDFKSLQNKLKILDDQDKKVLLMGVSFALLDFAVRHPMSLKNTVVMETGGMKGRRKELIRADLHERLKKGFGVDKIHSEYGMTELLSQAYSKGDGIFSPPPWMRVVVREIQDPLTLEKTGVVGGLNVIDLANVNSCSFIATEDLGTATADGNFEVLGRFDQAHVRGCNLMVL